MYQDWQRSADGLPREGQQIEFILDYRNVALVGTYTRQAFHTHWAEYGVERVGSWRGLTPMRENTPGPESGRALVVLGALQSPQ
ncbi:hypothetical protein [Dokdonella sp.]|uniref:hypothetical protein n=1 Tax=Dokdonella sp. TaxID=2291710 RepID=UPI0031C724DC|nr:hypothetical protein [Dokdonella sp.]